MTMDLSEPNNPSVVKDPTLVKVPKDPSGVKELPLAKDLSVVQNSRVKASTTVLEYTPKQCKISASDLRLIAYGHALNDKVTELLLYRFRLVSYTSHLYR